MERELSSKADNIRQRKQYERRIKEGLCRGCGGTSGSRKPKEGYRLCDVCLERKRNHYYRNRQAKKDRQKEYRERLKDEVFSAYGGSVCSCCGEAHKEFLTIDHINGDGADHRREIGKSTYKLLLWLKKSGYPKGFHVLCMNCNFSYGMKGYCPHKGVKDA